VLKIAIELLEADIRATRFALGAWRVAMTDLHSAQMTSAESSSFLPFAFITSKIIRWIFRQVSHHTRGKRSSVSMFRALLFLVAATSCRRVRGVWSSSSRPWNSARVDQDCPTLPACQTILNAVGGLLAYGCQVEKFLFAEDIFGFFGKLPINHRLVPKVVIPIHVCHCA